MDRKQELTWLGLSGVIPFAIGSLVVCLTPGIFPVSVGSLAYQITLVYGAVIASYMAGMGAGALVARMDAPTALFPGMLATLIAWTAAWPGSVFMTPGAAFRYVVIIGALAYLLRRDQGAVRDGDFPTWYKPLRVRLTLLACGCLGIAAIRMLVP